MSKLGRPVRTIRLPEEEPWVIPPPQPERERSRPGPAPVSVPEKERERVPAVAEPLP
jgi:hypothetical protein